MSNWIKLGAFLVLGILIAECFIGSLEAARHETNKETKELSSPTRWVFRAMVVILSVASPFLPCLWQTVILGVFVVLGFIWSKNKNFKENLGGKAAATAMLLLCIPVSIGVIINTVMAIASNGWNTSWKQIIWVVGPIVAILALLLASASKCTEEERPKDWVPQLILCVVLILAATALWIYLMKGGMLS